MGRQDLRLVAAAAVRSILQKLLSVMKTYFYFLPEVQSAPQVRPRYSRTGDLRNGSLA